MLGFVDFQQQKHPETVEKQLKMVNCRDKMRRFGAIFLTRKNDFLNMF